MNKDTLKNVSYMFTCPQGFKYVPLRDYQSLEDQIKILMEMAKKVNDLNEYVHCYHDGVKINPTCSDQLFTATVLAWKALEVVDILRKRNG